MWHLDKLKTRKLNNDQYCFMSVAKFYGQDSLVLCPKSWEGSPHGDISIDPGNIILYFVLMKVLGIHHREVYTIDLLCFN